MRHNPYLRQCPLFQGLSPEETDYALTYFGAKTKQYERGQFLHQVSFPLSRFGLVLDGTVQVYMDDMDGHQIIMNRVGPGELFGESYCFLGIDAPIYICAVTDAEILWMSPARVKAPVSPVQAIDQALSNRFIAALATRTLNLNQRIQILSQSRGSLPPFSPNTPPTRAIPLPSPSTGPAWRIFWGLTAAPCPESCQTCAGRAFWTFTATGSGS